MKESLYGRNLIKESYFNEMDNRNDKNLIIHCTDKYSHRHIKEKDIHNTEKYMLNAICSKCMKKGYDLLNLDSDTFTVEKCIFVGFDPFNHMKDIDFAEITLEEKNKVVAYIYSILKIKCNSCGKTTVKVVENADIKLKELRYFYLDYMDSLSDKVIISSKVDKNMYTTYKDMEKDSVLIKYFNCLALKYSGIDVEEEIKKHASNEGNKVKTLLHLYYPEKIEDNTLENFKEIIKKKNLDKLEIPFSKQSKEVDIKKKHEFEKVFSLPNASVLLGKEKTFFLQDDDINIESNYRFENLRYGFFVPFEKEEELKDISCSSDKSSNDIGITGIEALVISLKSCSCRSSVTFLTGVNFYQNDNKIKISRITTTYDMYNLKAKNRIESYYINMETGYSYCHFYKKMPAKSKKRSASMPRKISKKMLINCTYKNFYSFKNSKVIEESTSFYFGKDLFKGIFASDYIVYNELCTMVNLEQLREKLKSAFNETALKIKDYKESIGIKIYNFDKSYAYDISDLFSFNRYNNLFLENEIFSNFRNLEAATKYYIERMFRTALHKSSYALFKNGTMAPDDNRYAFYNNIDPFIKIFNLPKKLSPKKSLGLKEIDNIYNINSKNVISFKKYFEKEENLNLENCESALFLLYLGIKEIANNDKEFKQYIELMKKKLYSFSEKNKGFVTARPFQEEKKVDVNVSADLVMVIYNLLTKAKYISDKLGVDKMYVTSKMLDNKGNINADLEDSCNMYCDLKDYIKDKGIKFKFDFGEPDKTHDTLVSINIRKEMEAPGANNKIRYEEKELKLFNKSYEKIDFTLAEDELALVEAGRLMNICVGSYRYKALDKRCNIAIGRLEGIPVICIELSSNYLSIEQFKFKFNSRIIDTTHVDPDVIKECFEYLSHLRSNGINTNCYDLEIESMTDAIRDEKKCEIKGTSSFRKLLATDEDIVNDYVSTIDLVAADNDCYYEEPFEYGNLL